MWRPFPPSPPKYLLFCFKLYQRSYTLLRHSVLLACVCLLLVWDILVLTTNHYNVRTSATATVHPCVHTIIKAVPLFASNWTTAVPYHVFEWQNMPRGLLVLKCLLHLVTRMWGWCLESGTWFSCRTCNKLWIKYEEKKDCKPQRWNKSVHVRKPLIWMSELPNLPKLLSRLHRRETNGFQSLKCAGQRGKI